MKEPTGQRRVQASEKNQRRLKAPFVEAHASGVPRESETPPPQRAQPRIPNHLRRVWNAPPPPAGGKSPAHNITQRRRVRASAAALGSLSHGAGMKFSEAAGAKASRCAAIANDEPRSRRSRSPVFSHITLQKERGRWRKKNPIAAIGSEQITERERTGTLEPSIHVRGCLKA